MRRLNTLLVLLSLLVVPATVQGGSSGGTTTGGGGAGTVTSVNASGPSVFTWSGGPITDTGTLTAALNTQAANLCLAGPATGSAAVPTFRALVDADVPNTITIDLATACTALAANPANCSAGQIPLGITASGTAEGCYTPTSTTVGLSNVTNDAQTRAAIVPNTIPSAGQIQIGNAGGTAYAPQTLSGDCTVTSAGVITCFGSSPATVAKGGTGATTFTNHGVLFGQGGSAIAASAAGTAGYPLTSGGASADPSFAQLVPAALDFSADNTTANATTGHHGLLPKLSGNASEFLNGVGAFATPGAPAPPGSTTQVIFNDAGVFGADSQLTFNKTSGLTTITSGGHAGAAAFKVLPDSGTSYTQINDNGTMVVNADVAGTPILDLQYSGSSKYQFGYNLGTITNPLSLGGGALYVSNGGVIGVGSAIPLTFSSTSSGNGAADGSVSRIAAGVAGFGTGAAGSRAGWMQWAGECFVASDQTNATTTMASSTCSITVTSGRKYSFVCELFMSDSVAADGAKIDFNGGTATATNFRAQVTAFDTALNLSSQVTALATASSATTFTGAGAFEVHGAFEPSANGTFIPEFAQVGHTTGTLTLNRGSNCRMFDMP